jgi:predicted Zn-dependent protease
VQHDLDPKTLTDVAIRDDEPDVYSDARSYEGPLPALSVGSVIEEEVSVQDKAAFFEGVWSLKYRFGGSDPALRTQLVVEVPNLLDLHYVVRDLPGLQTRKVEVNGHLEYSFEMGRMEAVEPQPLLPPEAPRAPYVEFTTASNWAQIAREYWKRTEVQIRPADVKAAIGSTRPEGDAQISEVLAKVHSEVRYTGLEFGESSLVPQPPAEILKRKYGDCKDKAALLVSMLRAVGIPANLALLNAGSGQDVDPEMPGLSRFNHAIVYIPGREMFIDATAEYMRVGELPSEDQNRWALVVAEGTTELKRIPQMPSSANRWVEKRDFFLNENGPARVVETTLWSGDLEAYYRSVYAGKETKNLKKNLDGYAKSMYLADAVSKYDYSNPNDLGKQFNLRLEIEKAKRGSTELNDAVVAIRLADMVADRIPADLQKETEKDGDAATSTETVKSPSRTQDWYLGEVSQTEWEYHIVPSLGFHVRKLPENTNLKIGPASLKQTYKALPDGSVEGSILLDLSKRKYTTQEVTDLREGLRQLQAKGVLFIYFDLTPYTLLQQAKPREALAEYRKLIAAHPKEAVHRAQLAQAYLTLSLGELARAEAQAAVRLDPTSAVAYNTQGWVLQHDLVGRKFTRGFDPVGAAAAFRSARQFDPKNVDYAISLGESLEFDTTGERYSESARLNEAIAVYRELRNDHDADQSVVCEHLLYALTYANRFGELRDLLAELGDQQLYNAMRVLATGAVDGGEAAVRRSAEITGDEKTRSNVLATAGTVVMRARLYPAAAEMLAAAAPGQTNGPAMSNLAVTLKHTQKCETLPLDDSDPEKLVWHVLRNAADPAKREDLLGMLSRASQELPKGTAENIVKEHWSMRFNVGLPENVMIDIVLSSVKLVAEGEPTAGYRVSLEFPGTKTEHVYVVKEDGVLKILSESDELGPAGQEILDRVARRDFTGAKILLDWIRTDRKLVGGEDPFAGATFARVWNKGQDADPTAMKVAGISLLLSVHGAALPYVAYLETALSGASTESEKTKIEEVLMLASSDAKDWPTMEKAARTLLSQNESSTVFREVATSLEQQGKWSSLSELVAQHKDKLSDDFTATQVQAHAYIMQNQPAKATELLKGLVDSGKADLNTINEYGWTAVMSGNVTSEAIQTLQTTVQQAKNQSYGILHTLACMYAVSNRPAQAQQLLLETMKLDKSVDEPESSIWFGFGLLAESYGETQAAAQLYKKVVKPKYYDPSPESTYVLAQQRLASFTGFQSKAAAE